MFLKLGLMISVGLVLFAFEYRFMMMACSRIWDRFDDDSKNYWIFQLRNSHPTATSVEQPEIKESLTKLKIEEKLS